MDAPQRRPELSVSLTVQQLMSWYWLKGELQQLARKLGISPGGSKQTLTRRIAAALDGVAFIEPAVTTRAAAAQLAMPLTADTIVPAGQRCSQVLRRWFVEQIGDEFRFDGAMRRFITGSDGSSTLGEAVAHWYATRDDAPDAIGEQFEFNRFNRTYFSQHPDSTREQMLTAWAAYRDRPIQQRGRI